MRIIDTRSGKDVKVGEWVTYPHPRVADGCGPNPDPGVSLPGHGMVDESSYRILSVNEGLMSATVEYETAGGHRGRSPLTVRFMHPAFMFQKIAFVPS